jgi:hypothetical protein
MAKINVKNTEITVISKPDSNKYICITDIARFKNPIEPKDVVKNWLRNRSTIEFLGLWEKINNPNFKGVEFDPLFIESAKINYHIHTSAVSRNLVPKELSKEQINFIYSSEADVLNVALFGMTAKEWRESNPGLKGNIRDYATINELICLSNMENLNAVFINEGLLQPDRLTKLNQIAIQQMSVLQEVENRKLLK